MGGFGGFGGGRHDEQRHSTSTPASSGHPNDHSVTPQQREIAATSTLKANFDSTRALLQLQIEESDDGSETGEGNEETQERASGRTSGGESARDGRQTLSMPAFGFRELDNSRFRLVNRDADFSATSDLVEGIWRFTTGSPYSAKGVLGMLLPDPGNVGIGIAVGIGVALLLTPAGPLGGTVLGGELLELGSIAKGFMVGEMTTEGLNQIDKGQERFNGLIEMMEAARSLGKYRDHVPGFLRESERKGSNEN